MARSSPLWRHYGGRVIKRARKDGGGRHCIISRALPAYAPSGCMHAPLCLLSFSLARESHEPPNEVSNWPWSLRFVFLFLFIKSIDTLAIRKDYYYYYYYVNCSVCKDFRMREKLIFIVECWFDGRSKTNRSKMIEGEGRGVGTKSRTDQPRSRSQPLHLNEGN